MSMRSIQTSHLSIWAVITLLTVSRPCNAHNGAVAIAVPVQGIVVDGDLSDWPEDGLEYQIRQVARDTLTAPEDFKSSFKIGYGTNNALYLAVEVLDESTVLDTSVELGADGCSVTLDVQHNGSPVQMVSSVVQGDTHRFLRGKIPSAWDDLEYAVRRQNGRFVYEWMMGFAETQGLVTLQPETTFGLGIAVFDTDEDGSSSFVTWGSGPENLDQANLGDVTLFGEALDLPYVLRIMRSSSNDKILREDREYRTTYHMLSIGVTFTFAVVHLLLFLFYSKSIENCYYSAFVALLGLSIYSAFRAGLTDDPVSGLRLWAVMMLLILAASFAGLRFLYALFYTHLPKQFLVLLLVCGSGGLASTAIMGDRFENIGETLYLAMTAVVIAEMIRVLVVSIKKKEQGALLVAIGFVGLILSAPLLVSAVYTGWPGLPRGPESMILLGIVCLVVPMSVHLARNFGRTNRNLEARVIEIQELSAANLEHERALREDMEKELQTAREMQMGLMPTESPHVEGLEVSARRRHTAAIAYRRPWYLGCSSQLRHVFVMALGNSRWYCRLRRNVFLWVISAHLSKGDCSSMHHGTIRHQNCTGVWSFPRVR